MSFDPSMYLSTQESEERLDKHDRVLKVHLETIAGLLQRVKVLERLTGLFPEHGCNFVFTHPFSEPPRFRLCGKDVGHKGQHSDPSIDLREPDPED